ncbi:hypothetical protein MAPG_04906 [Magnaporthiopsis poae ATCC 64411]|uniref:Uncharacterized protein n=1 Tax=Magnaporthiopsis poae (strain ATCC 64411 / 73-15) TaxID=644358 RepID=A0A0C4DXZ8_MAGP6|nr:hypothetical protein MAPG_04906 [Magnaporthiopsis poae ATCC 64411]
MYSMYAHRLGGRRLWAAGQPGGSENCGSKWPGRMDGGGSSGKQGSSSSFGRKSRQTTTPQTHSVWCECDSGGSHEDPTFRARSFCQQGKPDRLRAADVPAWADWLPDVQGLEEGGIDLQQVDSSAARPGERGGGLRWTLAVIKLKLKLCSSCHYPLAVLPQPGWSCGPVVGVEVFVDIRVDTTHATPRLPGIWPGNPQGFHPLVGIPAGWAQL